MIYTGYFSNIRNMPEMTYFSIAGLTPTWYKNSGNSNFRIYSDLAPKWSWWKVWNENFGHDHNSIESIKWYSEKYKETILDKLDIKKIIMDLTLDTLHKDVCLLCYETPNKFCHRQLVAKWFNSYGIECREYI